jgi:hypothetical protein
MPIQIAGALIPKNGGTFYLLEDTYFRGGLRVAADVTARNSLHPSCKKAGMFVWTQSDRKLWQLQADLSTYVEYNPSVFYTHSQDSPNSVWTVTHNKGSTKFVYNAYDSTSGVMLPDSVISVDSNTIQVTFKIPITGKCTFAFDLSV